MTHLSPKRNMVPKASLIRSDLVSLTTARPVNIAQPKTKRVNTVSGKNVNTARPKVVVNAARPKVVLNAVKGNQVNAVKASAYWVWKLKTKIQVSDGLGSQKKLIFLSNVQKLMEDMLPFEVILKEEKSQLTDESHVLLKVPRKNNMYSVILKNIVPKGGIACLFAKATSDESKLWHKRLGHINFKTMNNLVKENLVRGLPLKLFKNDKTCVACQKGKQHRAYCKSKTVRSISQPLHMLHMDLFGPTFVKSLMKWMYCLVVIDYYSRFSWVFFLATKDETSGILKSFITRVENVIDQRVKVIRYKNRTEFKNKDMNQFCERKRIKREFSVARTPQQNRVAKRKNRTLIEAARTILADSKLPTTFWAEAVNTPCYVQNRVLVTKPHNKTPYELFLGRKQTIRFMRPFGCPVTILNTIDHLGKFDGKADEGFFVGYSINRSGPNWLFDIDVLTKSMNYKPVIIGNQSNGNAGTKAYDNADSKSSPDAGFKSSSDGEKKVDGDLSKEDERDDQEKDVSVNSTSNVNTASDGNITNNVNAVSSIVNTADIEVNDVGVKTSIELPDDPNMPELEDIVYLDDDEDVIHALKDPSWIEAMQEELLQFNLQEVWTLVDLPNGKRAIGTIWVFKNKKDERGTMIKNKARLVDQGYTKEEGVDYDKVFDPVARIEAIRLFLAYASFKDFVMYQMDVKSAWKRIFKKGGAKAKHGMEKSKSSQMVCKLIYLFGSTKKSLCTEFEKMMHKKFQMSSMGELTFFLGLQVKQKEDGIFISQDKYVTEILKKFGFTDVKTASTPMETQKPLLKDEDGEEVDVHLYRSMISSLMYLTSSRPDIMFAVIKRSTKIGRWYLKDLPFDLVAYTDSDYARASLDKKSTTRGCQFLGCRLISWQCKKQIVVANSITEAKYVAASSCCGQVL
ncbi:putative ribonuclease H-like domain-containing protein [Tanacetum coccineum]